MAVTAGRVGVARGARSVASLGTMSSFDYVWHNPQGIGPQKYDCGYCGNRVASERGYVDSTSRAIVLICPSCTGPTILGDLGPSGTSRQIPGTRPGGDVEHVPERVSGLYDEARDCFAVGAHTATVLCARKLLMNIGVEQGADAGKSFVEYVDHLASQGFVPPGGRVWVDQIRQIGNEATHEIDVKTADEAVRLLSFLEMLLKFIYEFPAKAST